MMTYKFSTVYFSGKQAERHCWLQGTLFEWLNVIEKGLQFVHVIPDTDCHVFPA